MELAAHALARREILAPCTKKGTPRVLFFSAQTGALIERVWNAQRMWALKI